MAITRLRMQDCDRAAQQQLLQQALNQWRERQRQDRINAAGANLPKSAAGAAAAATVTAPSPAELTFKAALRLAIEVIEDQTLKTAAISCGTSYRPEQIRGALKVFAENFDMAAGINSLLKSTEQT